MLVQEYGVWRRKVLFGSDYPFTTVDESIRSMRTMNNMLDGTALPRLNMDEVEALFVRDSLRLLNLGWTPLSYRLNCLFSFSFFALTPAHAEEPWWRQEQLRIIDVSTSLTDNVGALDPMKAAAAKAALHFNVEHLDVMQIAGGLDDDHFYFVSKLAGKQNLDYLKTYLPEAHKRGIRVLIYFDVHW